MLVRGKHVAAPASFKLAAKLSGAVLWSVNVNKAAAGATLTIYDGEDATGAVLAVVDCGSLGSWWYGILCNAGIYYTLAGGSPDVTIGYS